MMSLLGIMLKTQKQLADRQQSSWLGTVRELLKQLTNPTMTIPNKASIAEDLQDQFKKDWYEHLWGRKGKKASPKLKWYRKLKTKMKREDYLNGPRTEIQQAMARFRSGCHNLPVEVGRWERIKYKHRICLKCPLKTVGNEPHIFNCPAYEHLKSNGKPTASSKHQFIKLMRQPSQQTRTFIRDVLKPTGNTLVPLLTDIR